MQAFDAWWDGLTTLNQWFFIAAAFFSVIFLLQLVLTLLGLGADHGDLDAQTDAAGAHHSPEDAAATMTAFKLLTVRSIMAFLTLFSWAGALYLSTGRSLGRSLGFAVLWGAAAMVLVAWMFTLMRKLGQSGSLEPAQCVGRDGTVYMDIPAGGEGEIRALCGGVMTHLRVRCPAGALKSGAPVRIVRLAGPNLYEVEPRKDATA